MSLYTELKDRSENKCELCASDEDLTVYEVLPVHHHTSEEHAMLCEDCITQIENPDETDANHWRCLNDSMWSDVAAIQVLAWRMLTRLKKEGWPRDLLEMLYLDDEMIVWAEATGEGKSGMPSHVDGNGAALEEGDTVTLTKDLDVKGSTITAKRGTAVRRITLVDDNPNQIEGKIDGQQIVILTEFCKKVS